MMEADMVTSLIKSDGDPFVLFTRLLRRPVVAA
jgi:hypothetical protein